MFLDISYDQVLSTLPVFFVHRVVIQSESSRRAPTHNFFSTNMNDSKYGILFIDDV